MEEVKVTLRQKIKATYYIWVKSNRSYWCLYCGKNFTSTESLDEHFKDCRAHPLGRLYILAMSAHDQLYHIRYRAKKPHSARNKIRLNSTMRGLKAVIDYIRERDEDSLQAFIDGDY